MKKEPNHKINQQWNIQSNELVQVLDESKKTNQDTKEFNDIKLENLDDRQILNAKKIAFD